MKYFCVSDIHGFFNFLKQSLNDAGFDASNPEHCLISLGDIFDRGSEPIQCLKFVNSLPNKILIRGNHQTLVEEALKRGEFLYHDWHNGTVATVSDLAYFGIDSELSSVDKIFKIASNNIDYNKYINSLVNYFETDKYIFVHGWIPCKYDKDTKTYSFTPDWRNGNWNVATWINGMEAWSNGIKINNKTIICGHWHTSWGHHFLHNDGMEWENPRSTNPEHRRARFDPFIDDGIIAIDACTAHFYKVYCVVIED